MKRLRSEFLHVKADHLKARPYNRAKFGENATIYPFKNFDFQAFVEVFVKNKEKLRRESPILSMIKKGKYEFKYLYPFKERDILITKFQIRFLVKKYTFIFQNTLRQERLAVVDGGNLISEPWAELEAVSTLLKLNITAKNPFAKENFVKRYDGFYCIKNSKTDKNDLICMPESKGRSKNVADIPEAIERYLYDYYEKSNLKLVKRFNRQFSWMGNFENFEDLTRK